MSVTVNDRTYAMPARTAIVICLDGCEPAYLDEASKAGKTPVLDRIRNSGSDSLAHSVIPSFTNPNNMSIATGRPPAVHGICGNYLYEPENDAEVMMNDPRFLRAPTLFKAFQDAGARIAIVTAKDKLRALLGYQLDMTDNKAICFSTERSADTTLIENGIDNASAWLNREVPEVYSAALSEFVFEAGVKLLKEFKPDIMYLTTTDYIQHKHAPEDAEAISFYEVFDRYLGELDALGASIVITADHGMKAKHLSDGSPDVVYLQDVLDEWYGAANTRVILPITDPYVVHHGALGSFATAYLPENADVQEAISKLSDIEGLYVVLTREEAASRFELPQDRLGDIVLVSSERKTIGTSESRHDLSGLNEPLRSHGGLTEQVVPFIVNARLNKLPAAPDLRNFDAFYFATQAASAT